MGGNGFEAVIYLPASLVRAVTAGGPRVAPWYEEVQGTMVMADLSGFTPLSEGLARLGDEGAERLTGVINSFFAALLGTASRFGGDTLTFGGDAILLLFRGEGHAPRAVAAALCMLRQTGRTAAVETGDGRVKLGMSVGAHSGVFPLVTAGLDGESLHLFIPGRGAELTALAEACAQRGQLAVSAETRRLLGGDAAGGAPADATAGGYEDGWISRADDAGEFWLVDPAAEKWAAAGATATAPEAAAPPTETVGDAALRRLAPFLPPYARADTTEGAGRARLAPEHRRVCMVFVDILGLTEIIERDGLAAAVGQLQAYAVLLLGLAARHRGFVVGSDIATEGLKVIVTFGAPVAHEYAAANAARFALDLDGGLREAGLELRHRIGVNGGHVFAGEVGPAFRRQYTVMGDAVNLAARLMAAARPGEALASRELLDTAGSSLCGRDLPPLKVKGKELPVAVCVLEEERRAGGRSGSRPEASDAAGRLFGRHAELELLGEYLEQARRGHGRAVLVEGEAGVGKTRLLDEVLTASDAAAKVTRTACFEHLQAVPFTPWVDVLDAVFGVSRMQTTAARTRVVETYLERGLPERAELGSLLNPLLGVSLPQSEVVASLDARSRRARLFDLIARVVIAEAGDEGLVLVLEDLHWMDESSLELLRHLAGRLGDARLLVLLTARPTDIGVDLATAGVVMLDLAELSEQESLGMVREALRAAAGRAGRGIDQLPVEVGEAIYAKTRGNPLFLEEVVRALQAPSVLERILGASSVTRAAEMAALAIPDRVQGLLMSRIDTLTPEAREVLKAGSVVGRSFEPGVLEGMDDDLPRRDALEQALGELAAAALVVPLTEAAPAVAFRHALVQDVAYESLPFARRRQLHLRVASHLEAVEAELDHGLLVHHYSRAGEREKTLVHAAGAAEASTAVYAYLEAIDYLTVAGEAAAGRTPRDTCRRSRFEELTGDCLEALARHGEAIDRYVRARRRWASPAVRRAAGDALVGVSPIDDLEARDSSLCWKVATSAERGSSAYRRALLWLEKAEEALPHGRTALAARICIARGVTLSRLGRLEDALRAGEEGLELARQDGDAGLRAYALAMITHPLFGLAQFERAIAVNLEALTLYEEVGDLSGQGSTHGNLAACYQLTGDLRAALAHHERSLAVHARLAYTTGAAIDHANLGELLLQMGETDEALAHLREAVNLRAAGGVPPSLSGFVLILLSRALLRIGDLNGAEAALDEGSELLTSIDARGLLLDAATQEAELCLARGDAEGAARVCGGLRADAIAMGAQLSEAQALALLGRACLRRGEAAAAVEELAESVRLSEEAGADYERGRALTALAEAQAACGLGDVTCAATLDEAVGLLERMGACYDLARALEVRERLARASGAR